MRRQRVVAIFLGLLIASTMGCGSARSPESRQALTRLLYERSLNYIVNDSLAATICEISNPVPVRVWDTTGCSLISIGWFDDLSNFFYPTDRADASRYHDSLDNMNAQPCFEGRDVSLVSLSTSADPRRTLEFCAIDASYAPGYYIVPVYLYQDFHIWHDTPEDLVEGKDAGEGVGYTRFGFYLLIFDKDAKLVRAFSYVGEGDELK